MKDYLHRQTTDTKEYFSIWSQAVSLEYVTNTGILNEIGYGIYMSLLGILGKTSVFNAPERKQTIWFTSVDSLIQLDLVKYDIVNYEYNLTSKGHVMLEVLARSLMHKGVPKI